MNPDSALRAEAKKRGWEVRDFRTGRKAARIGIPAALAAGAAAGSVAAGIAARRAQRRGRFDPAITAVQGFGRRVGERASSWR